jgi:hypothetical protein
MNQLVLRIFLLLFIILSHFRAFCYENYLSGANYAALSNSAVALSSLWSVSHNQAGLADVNTVAFGVSHERRFLLNELSLSSVTLAVPVKPGTFGFDYSYFGYNQYHETKAGIAFGKRLGEKLCAGIKIDYFSTFLKNNDNKQEQVTFEAGLLSNITHSLSLGFHVFNPFPKMLSEKNNAYLPSVLRMGLAYNFENKATLSAETEKDYKLSPRFKFGADVVVYKQLSLRAGISTGINTYSFGLGYTIGHLVVDMAFVNHQVLGITPNFSIAYKFK